MATPQNSQSWVECKMFSSFLLILMYAIYWTKSLSFCKRSVVDLERYSTVSDFHIFFTGGSLHITLSIQWMKSLGKITSDYNALPFKFRANENKVTSRGIKDNFHENGVAKKLEKIATREEMVRFFNDFAWKSMPQNSDLVYLLHNDAFQICSVEKEARKLSFKKNPPFVWSICFG